MTATDEVDDDDDDDGDSGDDVVDDDDIGGNGRLRVANPSALLPF